MKMSVREARSNFAHALDLADRGETVTITRNGKAIAELGPPTPVRGGFDWAKADQVRRKLGLDKIDSPPDEDAWLEQDTDAAANRALFGLTDDWQPTRP